MRIRTILLAFALVIAAPGFTQNYNGFNYQAVIRNAAGDPLPNQAVGCGSRSTQALPPGTVRPTV
ncbi:MAG: hypothetical protein IPH53_05680 [Flavobacteriales bacterium]|nr:hypothetical protein [Flavobacteriales bacterium]